MGGQARMLCYSCGLIGLIYSPARAQELKERLQAAAAEGDEMAAAALAAAEVLAAAGAQSDAAGKALESALGILVPDSWERTELGEVAVAALELFAASGVDPGTVPMLPPWSEEEEADKYKPGFGFAHYAAYKDRADVLALLARLGANLEAGGPAGTPLQIAAGGDAADVVRALCAAGVDVNARAPLDFPNSDLAGATALHFAVASPGSPHPDNLQVLLDAGADPLLMDAQGRTPYAFLMDKIQEDLYLGPNLSYGWSALYQEQIDAVSILLSAQEAAKKAGTQRAGM